MDQEQKKINKFKLSKISIVLIACILTVAISFSLSYAWVSKNLKVNDSGLSFSLSPDLLDTFSNTNKFVVINDDNETEEFVSTPRAGLLPGSESEFYLGMFNKTNEAVSITHVGIEIPTVWSNSTGTNYSDVKNSEDYDEIPIFLNNTEYYFGHNIKIRIEGYTIYKASYDESNSRVIVIKSDSSDENYNPTFVSNQSLSSKYLLPDDVSKVTRIELLSDETGISLGSSQAILFKVCIDFENKDDADQSMFMGFGTTSVGGRCHRLMYAIFNQS